MDRKILVLLICLIHCYGQDIVQGRSLDQLCLDFPNNKDIRSKRSLPQFSEIYRQFLDYICHDGSLMSCGATLVNILPTRFYVNVNRFLGNITGHRGVNRVQEAKLAMIRSKIALAEAKIQAKLHISQNELRNLHLQERALQLEILKVFSVLCKHYRANTTIS